MDITHAQLVPVPNPASAKVQRKENPFLWRIISNLTFFNICSMKLAFRRKQESLLKKMYENTPQWHHSFFDKCEFWEGTLNLLGSQVFFFAIFLSHWHWFYCERCKTFGFQRVSFFMFWTCDLPHMVWLI